MNIQIPTRSFRKVSPVVPILLLLMATVTPAQSQTDAEEEIVALTQEFIHCLNTADLEATLALFADDATLFEPFSDRPGRIQGKEEIARAFEPLFIELRESGPGPKFMKLVPRDVKAQIHGLTAVVTFHLGKIPDEPLERPYSFSRRTLVLTRSEVGWRIWHLHASNILIPPAG